MDAALLHPSRFLKSQEFNGKDVTYTIASIVLETLEDTSGSKKRKGLIGFAETEKLLVINRTNSECMKAMWGRETDNWLGKRVTLFPDPFKDQTTGEMTTAIRVRGSPDIDADITTTISLPRKKPFQKKLLRTGKAQGKAVAPSGDELEAESKTISEIIALGNSPEQLDEEWTKGLGVRIDRLPADLKTAKRKEFAARKTALRTPPPAAEPPPAA